MRDLLLVMPRIALAQIRTAKGDYGANLARLGGVFRQIAGFDQPIDLLITPETVTSGYFVEGAVRVYAESGLSALLAAFEIALALLFFAAAVVILSVAATMVWDLLFIYGVGAAPDSLANRSALFGRLVKLARIDQDQSRRSKWVAWWRLIGIAGIGVLFLGLGITRAFGLS